MKNKMLIALLVISNCIFFSLKPITNSTALSVSGLVGVATGFSLYAVGDQIQLPYSLRKKYPTITGVTGGLSSLITYSILYKYTPQARYNKALKLFNQIKNYPLINEKLTAENQAHVFKQAGLLKAGLNIPFIEACRELVTIDGKIEEIKILCNKALIDVSVGDDLEERIKNLMQDIDKKTDVLIHNLGYIKLQDQKLYADLLKADATLQQAYAQQQSAKALGTVARSQTSQEVRGWLSFPLKVARFIIKD